jgi:hypothetical protein
LVGLAIAAVLGCDQPRDDLQRFAGPGEDALLTCTPVTVKALAASFMSVAGPIPALGGGGAHAPGAAKAGKGAASTSMGGNSIPLSNALGSILG